MISFLAKSKEFFLDLLFPYFCVGCQKEGSHLCQDCLSLVDVAQNLYCPFCDYPKIVFDGKTCFSCRRTKSLQGLFFAASYKDFITKKLISQFKYPPYIKDVSKNLVSLI